MLAATLELEVSEYIVRHAHLCGQDGLRGVVRNSRAELRFRDEKVVPTAGVTLPLGETEGLAACPT